MELRHIRILEGKSMLWDDITKAYRKEVMVSDYKVMHSADFNKLRLLANTKPFFSDKQVIEVHLSKVTSKVLNQLKKIMESEWVCLIMCVTNMEDFSQLGNICKLNFNGYKIPEKFWCSYVTRHIGVKTNCNLVEVYKSLAGRFELTDVIVEAINKTGGKCSVASLKRMIGKKDKVGMAIIWFNILTCNHRGISSTFKYLEEYRFGYGFLYKELCNKYEETMRMYKDFYNGDFNELNFREYKRESKLSEWFLRAYLEVFSTVSFDELQVVGEMIYTAKVNSTASLFALIGDLFTRHDE